MRRLKRLLAAIIIAGTVFLTASFGKAPAEKSESDEDVRPDMLAVNSAVVASIRTEAKRVEGERIKELKRIADEAALKRKQAEAARIAKAKAKADAKRKQAQETPSRSQAYVGKAQAYEVTFYTAFCPSGCTGVTASGYDVSKTIYYEGMRILAAPKSVQLYSIMRVTLADGSTFDGIVLDRGGDIGAGRLDVLVGSRDEAYRLGRQSVEVRLIRKGR